MRGRGGDGLEPRTKAMLVNFLRRRSARDGLGSLSVHALRIMLQLAISILLARILLPVGLGHYAFAMAIVSVAIVPAQFGLGTLILRETARAIAEGEEARVMPLWQWATKVGAASSTLVVVLLVLAGTFLLESVPAFDAGAFYLGIILVPFSVLLALGEASLQGLRRPFWAILPGYVLRPLLFLVFVALAFLLGGSPGASQAIVMQTLALVVATGVVLHVVLGEYRNRVAVNRRMPGDRRTWLTATLTFLYLQGLWVILSQTDILMLGFMSSAEEVGLYRVAVAGAAFVLVGMNALNAIIGERAASLHASGDKEALQRTLAFGSLGAFGFAAPLAVVLILGGGLVISLMFGKEFTPAAASLAILSLGHLVHVATGYSATLLGMTNGEGSMRGCSAVLRC
jgi:O-antigen/teichoic acid export membrane protein